jgi:hypothetical protein
MQSGNLPEFISFCKTYSTLEAERQYFVGEKSPTSPEFHVPYPPGVYRLVDNRLLRIAPALPGERLL